MSKQSGQEHPETTAAVKKTKRNRRPTACSVKRRSYRGCGICGSENTAIQGVEYCAVCGEETETLHLTQERWRRSPPNLPCSCSKWSAKTIHYVRSRWIGVGKCLDCGAVKSRFCPNGHDAWKHWRGGIYCATCGYRRKP